MIYLILSIYFTIGLIVALVSLYRSRVIIIASNRPFISCLVLLGIVEIVFIYPYLLYKKEL